jgi:hypothetical protein
LNLDTILGLSDGVAPDYRVKRSLDTNSREGTGGAGEAHTIVLNAAKGSDRNSRCAGNENIGRDIDIRDLRVGSAAKLNPTIAARQGPVLDANAG